MNGNLIRIMGLACVIGMTASLSYAQKSQPDSKMTALPETAEVHTETFAQPHHLIDLIVTETGVQQDLFATAEEADLKLMHSKILLPENPRITLKKESIILYDAHGSVSEGTGLPYALSQNQQLQLPKMPRDGVNDKVQETVTGRVTHEQTNEALPGVTILLKHTNTGTVTNIEGRFELIVPSLSDTLIFSFVGYQTREIPIEGRTRIDVSMVQSIEQLDEVVAIGYGYVRKSEITSSISTISAADLEYSAVSNLGMAMQGRASGVELINSGEPGGTPSIRIRGIGSINSTDPLIVLDGVPVDIDVFAQISPTEVQSIEILKDAAAGAIYGTRAANGVILITTKSGRQGERTTVRFNSSVGVNSVIRQYPVLSGEDLYMLKRESFTMDGLSVPANMPWAHEYYNTTRTNWQDHFFQEGMSQDYNITVSGGTDKSTINAHLNYRDEDGTQINSSFNRIGLSLKATQEISDRLRFEGNLRMNQTNDQLNYDAQASSGTLFAAYFYHPSIPVRYGDGNLGAPIDLQPFSEGDWGSGRASNELGDMWNPIYKATEEWYTSSSLNSLVNLNAEFDVTRNIVLTGRTAYSHRTLRSEIFNKPTPLQSRTIANPTLEKTSNERISWLGELFTTYNKRFGEHGIMLTSGTTAQVFDGENMSMRGDGFASLNRNHLTLSNADILTGSGSPVDPTALASLFARGNYNYSNKYYLSATIRADGSSRFAKGNRWGYFPAVSGAWRISEEKFMSNLRFLSDLKMSVGWGQLGDQNVSPFQYLHIYQKDQRYILGGRNVTGARPASFANPAITWETSETINLSLEAGLFDHRLNWGIAYFDRRRRGMLISTLRQFTMGSIGIPNSNIGDIRNHGFEIELSSTHQVGNIGSINVGANASFIENDLVKLHGGDSFISSGPSRSYEGGPLSAFYGWKTAGIYQLQSDIDNDPGLANDARRLSIRPGDVRFVDINGDGMINDDDRTQIGDPNPFMSYGFFLDVGYRGFKVSANFSGLLGYQVYDAVMLRNMQPYEKFNMHANAIERWTGPGTSDKWPRLSRVAANSNYRESDLAIQNADYLRLKDVVVSYTLPRRHLQTIGMMQNVRMYLSGRNLITLTGADLVDPEESSSFSNIRRGIIVTEYPQSRTVTFGIDLTF